MITKNRNISIDYLKECLDYNPESGIFYRKNRPLSHFPDQRSMSVSNAVYGGKEAGGVSKKGYVVIYLNGYLYKAHRLAFLYMTGEWPDGYVDHINHQKEDNRWCNLRVVSAKENSKNKPMLSNNTSGVTGVHFDSEHGAWRACINIDGKPRHMGRFHDIWDAICARKSAENIGGYHANHGLELQTNG